MKRFSPWIVVTLVAAAHFPAVADTTLEACGYHSLPYRMEEVPSNWSWHDYNEEAMQLWNRHMNIYQSVASNGTWGQNGVNEFGGFPSNADLHYQWGFNWQNFLAITVYLWTGTCGHITETDILFNPDYSWTTSRYSALINSNYIFYPSVLLHEMGHSWGLQTRNETYNYSVPTVMKRYYSGIWQDNKRIHVSDAYLLRRQYSNQTGIISRRDMQVCSIYPSDGDWLNTTVDASEYVPGDPITFSNILVENVGTQDLSNVGISFYLTPDYGGANKTFLLIGFSWPTFRAERYGVYDFTVPGVPRVRTGDYWVGMRVRINSGDSDDNSDNDEDLLAEKIHVTSYEDPYEPNNSVSDATDLSNYEGIWLSEIEGKGAYWDADYYMFRVLPGRENVVVDCQLGLGERGIELHLTQAAGNIIAVSQPTTRGLMIDCVVPSPGIYYIEPQGDVKGNVYDFCWYSFSPGPRHTISGSAGTDVAVMSFASSQGGKLPSVTANIAGDYFCDRVPYGWSGTITPSKSGYWFAPPRRALTNVTTDISGVNFKANMIRQDLGEIYRVMYWSQNSGLTELGITAEGVLRIPDGATDKDWLKITWQPGARISPPPPIFRIESPAGFKKLYTVAPILTLQAAGSVRDLTAAGAYIAWIEAPAVRNVRMSYGVAPDDDEDKASAAIMLSGPGDGKGKIQLCGVGLRRLRAPGHVFTSISAATKKTAGGIVESGIPLSEEGANFPIEADTIGALALNGARLETEGIRTNLSRVVARCATLNRTNYPADITPGWICSQAENLSLTAVGGDIAGQGIITSGSIAALRSTAHRVRGGQSAGGNIGQLAGSLPPETTSTAAFFTVATGVGGTRSDIQSIFASISIRGQFMAGASYQATILGLAQLGPSYTGLLRKLDMNRSGKAEGDVFMNRAGEGKYPLPYGGNRKNNKFQDSIRYHYQ